MAASPSKLAAVRVVFEPLRRVHTSQGLGERGPLRMAETRGSWCFSFGFSYFLLVTCRNDSISDTRRTQQTSVTWTGPALLACPLGHGRSTVARAAPEGQLRGAAGGPSGMPVL